MRLTAPAWAARRALLQRFLALSGVLAVAVLLFLAATSRSQAFNPEYPCGEAALLPLPAALITRANG